MIEQNIEHKVTIEQLQRELVEKDSLLLEARTALQRYAEVGLCSPPPSIHSHQLQARTNLFEHLGGRQYAREHLC